jgi:hypothetical protein
MGRGRNPSPLLLDNMTTARFNELKANPDLITNEIERGQYLRLLKWEKSSAAAKQAVRTKRAKYKQWPCNRKDKDMETKEVYAGSLLDISNPEHVEVVLKEDHKVLWVNIEGVCKLRVCNIQNFEFKDERYPGE